MTRGGQVLYKSIFPCVQGPVKARAFLSFLQLRENWALRTRSKPVLHLRTISVSPVSMVPCREGRRKTWKLENLSCWNRSLTHTFQEQLRWHVRSSVESAVRSCASKHSSWSLHIWPVSLWSSVSSFFLGHAPFLPFPPPLLF